VTAALVAPTGTAPTSSNADGLLALRLRPDGRGRTVIAERRQRFPLRTTVAFHLDERDPAMAFVYAQNPTGGVFAGDRLTLDVVAEPRSRVHLTSQSATKLCRSDSGEPGVQEIRIGVGEGAYVEHIPDALIPHAGARYRQRTTVELAEGATYIGSETIGPGRVGERFGYCELDLRTELRRDGCQLCVDALRLAPQAQRSPARVGVLGGHAWLATLLVVSLERDGEGLAARIDAALATQGVALAAAGPLPGGCGAVVRVLADRAPAARYVLLLAWAEARAALLGLPLPPLRK
jgi:urease accessory protein